MPSARAAAEGHGGSRFRNRPSLLAERLAETAERSFVGRDAEIEGVLAALESSEPPFAVLWLHGPAGIGKSALLRRLATLATRRGVRTALVSGDTVAADPDAFLTAVDRATSTGPWPDDDDEAPALLAVDGMDRLAPLADWLRERFIPRLPRRSVVVLAGQSRPSAQWHASLDLQGLFRVRRLPSLTRAECVEHLRRRAITGPDAEALAENSCGHPLALVLLADAYQQHLGEPDRRGNPPLSLGDLPDTVGILMDRLVGPVPSDRHLLALSLLARTWVTTETLMRSVLGPAGAPAPRTGAPRPPDVHDPEIHELFQWLRDLPFTEATLDGLAPDDLVRQVIDADLRWRDPGNFQALTVRVRDFHVNLAGYCGDVGLVWAANGVLHLVRRDGWRAVRTPEAAGLRAEPASAADRAAVAGLAARWGGADTVALVDAWWRVQPSAFDVVRAPDGGIAGFVARVILPAAGAEPPVVADDPVVRAVRRWADAHAPLRAGEHIELYRFWTGADAHQQPGPWSTVLGEPSVRRLLGRSPAVCTVVHTERPEVWGPLLEAIDFRPLPDGGRAGGATTAAAYVHDWRVVGVRDWLDRVGRPSRDAAAAPGSAGPAPPAPVVLGAEEFAAAVKKALSRYRNPAELEDSPLLRSRMVTRRLSRASGSATDVLRSLLAEAVGVVGDRNRAVLEATYLHASLTQESAARSLDLPFSTYRRHLAAALKAVTRHLWDKEVRDGGAPSAG